jgi:hypothetical protein
MTRFEFDTRLKLFFTSPVFFSNVGPLIVSGIFLLSSEHGGELNGIVNVSASNLSCVVSV